jgi:hypothetical protein
VWVGLRYKRRQSGLPPGAEMGAHKLAVSGDMASRPRFKNTSHVVCSGQEFASRLHPCSEGMGMVQGGEDTKEPSAWRPAKIVRKWNQRQPIYSGPCGSAKALSDSPSNAQQHSRYNRRCSPRRSDHTCHRGRAFCTILAHFHAMDHSHAMYPLLRRVVFGVQECPICQLSSRVYVYCCGSGR